MKDNTKILLLVAAVFLLKIILLPYSQTTHADAVTRVFKSINWLENPHWVKASVWGPFHYYINGLGLKIWYNPVYTPKLINIIFSCLSLLPFYYLIKREFNANGAFVATCFLACSPILFRYSFMALSETPYLFFLILSLNLLSKGVKQKTLLLVLVAGLLMSIGNGIRFEGWIVTFCISLVLLLYKQWQPFFVFSFCSALFPIYWLISCYLETGDMLYSFNGTYNWSIGVMDNNSNLDFEDYLRRIWFYPFSWVIAVGIPTGFIILKTLIQKKESRLLTLALPFLLMLLVYEFFAFRGVFLLQHHYVGTLVILSLPFVALYFKDEKRNKQALFWGVITILLSLVYNTGGVKPLSRIENQEITQFVDELKNHSSNTSLIIDFIGWDETYYLALNSEMNPKNIVTMVDGANATIDYKNVDAKLEQFENGFVLLKDSSELAKYIQPKLASKNTITHYQLEDLTLYYWTN